MIETALGTVIPWIRHPDNPPEPSKIDEMPRSLSVCHEVADDPLTKMTNHKSCVGIIGRCADPAFLRNTTMSPLRNRATLRTCKIKATSIASSSRRISRNDIFHDDGSLNR